MGSTEERFTRYLISAGKTMQLTIVFDASMWEIPPPQLFWPEVTNVLVLKPRRLTPFLGREPAKVTTSLHAGNEQVAGAEMGTLNERTTHRINMSCFVEHIFSSEEQALLELNTRVTAPVTHELRLVISDDPLPVVENVHLPFNLRVGEIVVDDGKVFSAYEPLALASEFFSTLLHGDYNEKATKTFALRTIDRVEGRFVLDVLVGCHGRGVIGCKNEASIINMLYKLDEFMGRSLAVSILRAMVTNRSFRWASAPFRAQLMLLCDYFGMMCELEKLVGTVIDAKQIAEYIEPLREKLSPDGQSVIHEHQLRQHALVQKRLEEHRSTRVRIVFGSNWTFKFTVRLLEFEAPATTRRFREYVNHRHLVNGTPNVFSKFSRTRVGSVDKAATFSATHPWTSGIVEMFQPPKDAPGLYLATRVDANAPDNSFVAIPASAANIDSYTFFGVCDDPYAFRVQKFGKFTISVIKRP